ncbi:thiolase family protein [Mycobacterium sp. M26]|uniref:thiolase family protein n=1 Tax=Mycobacterium sp. M26 TaxID=1762962 RepID=UPI00073EF175|nr:thiolase family protein [Mycobacterium sp. M26]
MPEAVIVTALRTPIGTAMKGTLRDTDAYQLADHIVGATAAELDGSVDRADIDDLILGEGLYGGGVVARHAAITAGPTGDGSVDRADIDDLILGEGLYGGGVVARHAAITAGLTGVPGLAANRHCAAGLAAVQAAAGSIRAGMDRLVIAGGVNSASTSPRFTRRAGEEMVPWFPPTHPDRPDAPNMDMSITVGWNAAVEAGVTREEMDAWALRSHRNAIAAIDEGRFKEEIVPIQTPHGLFDTDEHPRRDTTMEKLAGLKPLHPEIEGFSITAGNACGGNDAAAALAIASDALGLPALGTVRSWASVGVDPARTGLAPVEAIPKALARAGLSLDQVDLFEINEAFAAMCVATIKLLDIDPDRVNVSGSGCSLGHPVAATGARMLVTLTHELRRRGGGIGVAAMCAGGGMGSATVIEVPAP